jgi:hypothetical protein
MRNLTATFCLTIFVLLGSAGKTYALPPCPSDQNQSYDNCFGTYTHANGQIQEGIWKDDNFLYVQRTNTEKNNSQNGVATYKSVDCNRVRGRNYPSEVRRSSSIRMTRERHTQYFNNGANAFRKGNVQVAVCWFEPLSRVFETTAPSINATHNLGVFYKNGQPGLKSDPKRAIEFFKISAKSYNVSQWELGQMYELGIGVPVNLVTAAKWYQRAKNRGKTNLGNEPHFVKQAQQKLNLPKFKKVASKTGETEKTLESYYKSYMTVRECNGLGQNYISSNELKSARAKVKKIESYLKKKNLRMNTNTVWETSSKNWEKELGGTFKILKLANSWSNDMKMACRLDLMKLDSVNIPGKKPKTGKKDF